MGTLTKSKTTDPEVLAWAKTVKVCEKCKKPKSTALYESDDEFTVLCWHCSVAMQPKRNGPKLPTYAQAQKRLLVEFEKLGWVVVSRNNQLKPLKVPHATDPQSKLRFWFKPQTVWFGYSTNMAGATSTHVDTRTVTAEQLIKKVRR